MQGNPPRDSRRDAAEPRVHGREEIRQPAGGKPAKWPSLGFFVIHRGKDCHQTPDFAVCHGLGGRLRDREDPSAFCAFWSQIEFPALHCRHFEGLPAALGQEALSRSSWVPATGLCALSRFQGHPALDSEENPFIHKQRSLACKESWP